MIGFVAWPPLKQYNYVRKKVANYASGKANHTLILCYKLLYVIQGGKDIIYKVTSWPQLISQILVTHR